MGREGGREGTAWWAWWALDGVQGMDLIPRIYALHRIEHK